MKATKHGRHKGTFKKRMTKKQLILLISTQLSLNKNDNFNTLGEAYFLSYRFKLSTLNWTFEGKK